MPNNFHLCVLLVFSSRTQTEEELQNGGMKISSEREERTSAEKTKKWRNNTEKKGRKKKPGRRRCVAAEVCKCVAGQRVGRRGGEAGTLTDICWHAADAGGGHGAMTSGNMAH